MTNTALQNSKIKILEEKLFMVQGLKLLYGDTYQDFRLINMFNSSIWKLSSGLAIGFNQTDIVVFLPHICAPVQYLGTVWSNWLTPRQNPVYTAARCNLWTSLLPLPILSSSAGSVASSQDAQQSLFWYCEIWAHVCFFYLIYSACHIDKLWTESSFIFC